MSRYLSLTLKTTIERIFSRLRLM